MATFTDMIQLRILYRDMGLWPMSRAASTGLQARVTVNKQREPRFPEWCSADDFEPTSNDTLGRLRLLQFRRLGRFRRHRQHISGPSWLVSNGTKCGEKVRKVKPKRYFAVAGRVAGVAEPVWISVPLPAIFCTLFVPWIVQPPARIVA